MKLGHSNDPSTQVGSGIADWLRKGLGNNQISIQISSTGRLTPKNAIVKFTAEEKTPPSVQQM